MIVIGLTGSIGMGKTTVAGQFAALGVAVLDSDAVVHRLMQEDKHAIQKTAALFPTSLQRGKIERSEIAKDIFSHPEKLKKLEKILHPLVRRAQKEFIAQHKKNGTKAVLLDIPLLYETSGEKNCDVVVVVSAPAALQKNRVLSRPNMTQEKFARILERQMPDKEKRARADFVITTDKGMRDSKRQVREILRRLLDRD